MITNGTIQETVSLELSTFPVDVSQSGLSKLPD